MPFLTCKEIALSGTITTHHNVVLGRKWTDNCWFATSIGLEITDGQLEKGAVGTYAYLFDVHLFLSNDGWFELRLHNLGSRRSG